MTKKEELFSDEEIIKLNEESAQKDLEIFFFNCLRKEGEEIEKAKEIANNWAYEIKKDPLAN
jgi:hypothetical protein